MLRVIALSLLAVTLSGCSSVFGTAAYSYTHVDKNGASCTISVGSLRDVQGVAVRIDKNCTLTTTVDSLTTSEAMAKAILSLTEKIPSVPTIPLAP